jgi:DnaJ family protein A protein 5
MGNDQSRGSSSKVEEPTKPLDYYVLLQIDEDATFEEIKASYPFRPLRDDQLIHLACLPKASGELPPCTAGRRLQKLVNHPDKNPHRIEEATKLFADLQQAYEASLAIFDDLQC